MGGDTKYAGSILTCGSQELGGASQLQRSPLKSEGSELHTGLPSLEQQCCREEPPQHMAVKISRDSVCLGEMEDCWKPRSPLKGPVHRLGHV